VIAADLAGTPVRLDVTSGSSWKENLDAIEREHGGLDGLVNNAGIVRDALIDEATDEQWSDTVAVNLTGTMLGCRTAAPLLRSRRGRIVNLTSVSWLGNKGQLSYSASKGGVVSLTRTLAVELGRDGVLCNAVAPWFVESRMTSGVPERLRERFLKRNPLGRFADPSEIAGVVCFLLGPDASFVNGQTLTVCGGATVGI
jgi:3-oxoacyl-[acyl-carrier protein] reductase